MSENRDAVVDPGTEALPKRPYTDTSKYVDLKQDLAEVRDLLRQMIATVPVQKEYIELRKELADAKGFLQKQVEIGALLREMNTEWSVVTNRVIQGLGDAKKEKLDFREIYAAVLEKEMRLVAEIKEDINKNDERFFRRVVEMAAGLENITAPSWTDRAKQYGLQLAITLVLLAFIVGVYHLVVVVHLF